MNVIEISGTRFIKATDAAKRVGYTTDYVGQLVRSGKIEGQQIGRAWYVKEDDILAHKKGNGRSNKQKTQEAVHKVVANVAPQHAIYNSLYTPPEYVPEYRKRLLDAAVTYGHDEGPLTLSLKRGHEDLEQTHERLHVEADEEESLVHTTHLGKELSVEGQGDLHILRAERAPLPPMQGEVHIAEEVFAESEAEEDDEREQEEAETDESSEPQSRFEERLLAHERELGERRAHSQVSDQAHRPVVSTAVPGLTFIPAKVPGPRLPLSLTKRFTTALVPLALLLTLAFTCSSIFLEKVIVYQKGKGTNAETIFQTSYAITNVATVMDALSR